MRKIYLSLLGLLCLIAHLNAQYFSASDGITVGRLGKRSYLYNMLKMKPAQSAQADGDSSINQDDFRQIDKLSTMRKFYKQFGKRYLDDDESLSSEEVFLRNRYYMLPKDLLRKYFLKK